MVAVVSQILAQKHSADDSVVLGNGLGLHSGGREPDLSAETLCG